MRISDWSSDVCSSDLLAWRPGDILPNRPPITLFDDTRVAMQDAMRTKVRRPYVMDTEFSDRQIEVLVQLPDGVLQALAHKKRLFSSTTYIFQIGRAHV